MDSSTAQRVRAALGWKGRGSHKEVATALKKSERQLQNYLSEDGPPTPDGFFTTVADKCAVRLEFLIGTDPRIDPAVTSPAELEVMAALLEARRQFEAIESAIRRAL